MKMTTRVAYCNMRHYKSKNILIGIAIILTTLLLFVIPSIGKDMVEVNFAVINKIYPTWHALYRNVDESTANEIGGTSRCENLRTPQRCGVHESGRCDGFHDVYGQNRDGTL